MSTHDPKDLYHALIQHMREAVSLADRRGIITDANQQFCTISGYTLKQIVGKHPAEFFDKESARKIEKVNKHERKRGISSSYEVTLVTKKGKRVPMLINGTPLPGGGTMGIMTDLSEIRKKESLYRLLVENMNEAVWMLDSSDRSVYVNPKFCAMTGYSHDEIMGKKSYAYWDKDSVRKIKYVNTHERKRGISSSYEAMLVTKKGKHIPVLVSGTPLPDGGTMGMISDLSEIKKKESLYRLLVENMNEAVWMGDADERTIYANPKFCQMMGYRLEEIIDRQSYDFWDEKSAKKVRQVNRTDRKRGISSSYEGVRVTKTGKRVPVILRGTPLPDGGTIGIMTDLSELKEQEAKAKILTSAITHANDAIIIMDKNGKVESWNRGAKIVFGYKQEQIIGKQMAKIFSKEDVKDILSRSEIRYNFELKGKHKNGHPVIVSVTLTPVLTDDHTTAHYCLLIARDITSQSKYDEELALKYQKLRDAYNQFGVVRRQMDYIFELLDLAVSSQNAKLIGDFAVNAAVMLTRVDACSIRLYDEPKRLMSMLSSFGLSDEWRGQAVISFEESLVKRALENGAPLKIVDLPNDPTYHSKHLARKSNLVSALIVPLVFQGTLVGGLNLYAGAEKKLEIFENEFIEHFGRLVAMALARSHR